METSRQTMTSRTASFDARTTTDAARRPARAEFVPVPRPVIDVVRDVMRWQGDLLLGRDPGAVPIGETGWPLSRMAARTYFGPDVLAGAACAIRRS